MAISTLSLQQPETKEATRSQYQRAQIMLAAAWPTLTRLHPELTSDDHVVLAVILARGPGRAVMRQKGERPHVHRKTGETVACQRRTRGLADWLGWPRQRVWRSITRLCEAFLVWGVLYQQGDRLPTGKPARTNVVRYVVRVERIFGAHDPHAFAGMASRAEGEPPGGPGSGPSLGSLGSDSTSTPKPPSRRPRAARARSVAAATPPEDSQRAAGGGAESVASETPPSTDAAPGAFGEHADAIPPASSASKGREHDACRGDVAAVAAAWDQARIPWGTDAPGRPSVCRKNERTLIAERLRELGPALLLLAVAGAERDRRIREGREVRCSAAYVFASADRVQRFAVAGEAAARERGARELRDRAQALQQRAYERGQWLGADEALALAERELQGRPANDGGR